MDSTRQKLSMHKCMWPLKHLELSYEEKYNLLTYNPDTNCIYCKPRISYTVSFV